MKKICITILLIISNIFCLSSFADSKTDEKQIQTVKKLKQEYSLCLNKPNNSELDSMKCSNNIKKKYDIEIEKVIKELKNIMPQSQYQELIQAQNKWMEFTNAQYLFFENTPKKAQTNYYHMLSSFIGAVGSEKRLEELVEIYTLFSDLKNNRYY